MTNTDLPLLRPEWPAPRGVRALASTRIGGVSVAPYHTLNLGTHVGDDPVAVAENRRRLEQAAGLPASPRWLNQVHGVTVLDAGAADDSCAADASVTDRPGVVCAIMTADCLPVLFCNHRGTVVGAAHAGWRGLAAGVLEATVTALRARGRADDEWLAWLGPAIGPQAFEVGDEVRTALVDHDAAANAAFVRQGAGKWFADLFVLARLRLAACGVAQIYGGGICTVNDPARFFSHRRDRVSGRQASLIWLETRE